MSLFKKYYEIIIESTSEDRYRIKKGLKPLDELSPYEKLEKYKDDKNVYISFRTQDLIGINPKSQYDTPNGIYTYPLYLIWKDFDHERKIIVTKFADSYPFIYVVKSKPNIKILNTIEYNQNNYKKDILKIKIRSKKLNINKNIDQIISKADSQDSLTYVQKIWSIMYDLTFTRNQIYNTIGNKSNLWNRILYKVLNYDLVLDQGLGIIHKHEPTQGLFLHKDAFKILENIDNKFNLKTKEVEQNVWKGGIYPETVWENGLWMSGDFIGKEYPVYDGSFYSKNKDYSFWYNGYVKKGNFIRINWKNGIWNDGTFTNSYWDRGIWKNGTFRRSHWNNGTWEGGLFTEYSFWYTGIWEDGVWDNEDNKDYCFESGIWKKGLWKNGRFRGGNWLNGTWEKGTFEMSSIWHNGTWNDGRFFYGAVWKNGIWKNGTFKNSTWENGTWENGTWESGTWLGGTWLGGYDKDGNHHPEGDSPDKWIKNNIIKNAKISDDAKFEITKKGVIWYSGTWYDGKLEKRIQHNWKAGTWKKGIMEGCIWEGGTWENGVFSRGAWMTGVFSEGEMKDSNFFDGIFKGKTFTFGTFIGGTFKKGNFIGGEFGDENSKTTPIFDGGIFGSNDPDSYYSPNFIKGVWKSGTWKKGKWRGGTWLGGYDGNGNYHPRGDSPDKWNIK
jgi:hypothetical protein